MTSPARRAGAWAVIGALSVLAPVIGAGTAVLFVAIGLAALVMPDDSRIFEWLASPHDRETGQLRTVAGFVLAVAVLAILGTVDAFGLSAVVFAMAVLLVGFGHAGEITVRTRGGSPFTAMVGFLTAGIGAGLAGFAVLWVVPWVRPAESPALALFLVVVGGVTAGLYRTELMREDPIEVVGIGLLLWFFSGLDLAVDGRAVLIAVIVTFALGVVAYRTGTVTVSGMLSGILLAIVTFVIGGFGWFAMLASFFLVGGLSTKYRYDDKADRGVAESDAGRRGTANVLSNGIVPFAIVVGWASADALALGLSMELERVFVIAFAGAVATALADTLASEIGALYDNPRLITTFERVEPGTDGAVTGRGQLAGLVGATIVALIGVWTFPPLDYLVGGLVVVGGIAGMSADSMLGATVEGEWLGNDGVNLLATYVGAIVAAVAWLLVGVT